jgi:hypothetical protein
MVTKSVRMGNATYVLRFITMVVSLNILVCFWLTLLTGQLRSIDSIIWLFAQSDLVRKSFCYACSTSNNNIFKLEWRRGHFLRTRWKVPPVFQSHSVSFIVWWTLKNRQDTFLCVPIWETLNNVTPSRASIPLQVVNPFSFIPVFTVWSSQRPEWWPRVQVTEQWLACILTLYDRWFYL